MSTAMLTDDRIGAAARLARAAGEDLRSRALAIDADPDAMEAHLGSAAFALIRQSETPEEFRESLPGIGPTLLDRGSCLECVVGLLELARGDAATLLACPAPGLAGVFVDLFGSPAQKERFFTRLHGGRTWTFFAMTEPGRGTDATAMETRLDRDGAGGWRLTGAKRYIGNGARGGIGVVFGRTGRTALSIRAALVEVPAPGWQARRLDMIGLRGAHLSEIALDGVPVAGGMLLGEHLSVTRRGLWGATKTFNNMRVRVAASAVGTALAMTEYVTAHYKAAPEADVVMARAQAARDLVYAAAARIDRNPERGYPSNVAKLIATRMAVRTAHWAAAAMGPAGLLEHPLLEKWTRDACAFEFMEGTGNIQRLHIARGYQAGSADAC
jgi:alkylation response protein AidB-like acyl-CoA dehydrogenase